MFQIEILFDNMGDLDIIALFAEDDDLVNVIGHAILENLNYLVDLRKKIMFSVWILAKPESFLAAGDRFKLSKCTGHCVFKEIVTILANLLPNYIVWPDRRCYDEEIIFRRRSHGFPDVVGAIDGRHIPIKAPTGNPIDFYNRNKRLCLPFNDKSDDYPFRDNGHLTREQSSYNVKLSSIRSMIERAFGLLKGKFRRLKYLDISTPALGNTIIAAACVIHNFLIDRNEINFEHKAPIEEAMRIANDARAEPDEDEDLVATPVVKRRMESMRPGWKARVHLFLILLAATNVGGTKPEVVLMDLVTEPFVPREFASPQCIRDGKIYLKALEDYTDWAIQITFPSGMITGNYKQLGNFYECLQVKTEHGFVGQACNAAVQFEIFKDNKTRRDLDMRDLLVNVAIASNATKLTSGESIQYEWMFCVPSTCNHTDTGDSRDHARSIESQKANHAIPLKPFRQRRTLAIGYASILVLFALIIIASTGYDIAMQRRASASEGIFAAFSLYKNGKELLETDRHGLRFISICWIIYGHTYYMKIVDVNMNLMQILRMHYDWNNMLVLNGNIVTNTFFLLSGLLLAYNELLKKERSLKRRFDVIGFYLHRYIRLTPAYAMMIVQARIIGTPESVLTKTSVARIGGPTYSMLTTIEHVHVPILVPIDRHAVCLAVAACTVSYAQVLSHCFGRLFISFGPRTLCYTYYFELTGTMLYYKREKNVIQVYLKIYIKTYNRFEPYVIGLGLGYLLYKTRSCKVRLHTWCVILGWLIAIMAGLSVIFGPRGMYFDTHVYNKLEASFYRFPSSVIPSHVGAVQTPGNLTQMNIIREFIANLVLTMMISVLWRLYFETPFMTIDSFLLAKRKKNLTKHLETYDSTSSGEIKEISQAKKSSLTYDNPGKRDVTHCNLIRIKGSKENCANCIEYINDNAETSLGKIYFINPIKRDET
ncbi:Nose resistant to fluoxetine protein 6 [Temnothorax longispinosus]|uniref:Nose resistant to fluoxetine protein 6 n=1 Tax=Temnothorax longispinosus TaxID=300112 RepID=A0A4S2KRQ0_9HYME|nr:Nose resistant to fluoxetine protein 6 [Temnothorax longispinosus]